MRTIGLVLAVCLVAANAAPQKIIGGSVTNINQYPFAATLLYSWSGISFTQACGGTILNNRSVLSAAHCFTGDMLHRWRTRVGSTYAGSGGVLHTTASLINHPGYNSLTYDNDIAILRISGAFSFGANVAAGSIAGANYNLGDDAAVWAIGWGTTVVGSPITSEHLRRVQVWTVDQKICRERYGTSAITENMLCSGWLDVGGRDQCHGDFGSPLLHDGIVVGIYSWSYGCADPYYPSVNTRVSCFTPWITSNV